MTSDSTATRTARTLMVKRASSPYPTKRLTLNVSPFSFQLPPQGPQSEAILAIATEEIPQASRIEQMQYVPFLVVISDPLDYSANQQHNKEGQCLVEPAKYQKTHYDETYGPDFGVVEKPQWPVNVLG